MNRDAYQFKYAKFSFSARDLIHTKELRTFVNSSVDSRFFIQFALDAYAVSLSAPVACKM